MAKNKKNRTLKIQSSNQVRDVVMTVVEFLQYQAAFNTLKVLDFKRGKGLDRMMKFLDVMTNQFKDIEKAKTALITAHGKEQPNGTHVVREDDIDAYEAYTRAMNELAVDEIEIRLRPPSLDCLGGDTVPGVLADLKIFFQTNEEDEIPDKEESDQNLEAETA